MWRLCWKGVWMVHIIMSAYDKFSVVGPTMIIAQLRTFPQSVTY